MFGNTPPDDVRKFVIEKYGDLVFVERRDSSEIYFDLLFTFEITDFVKPRVNDLLANFLSIRIERLGVVRRDPKTGIITGPSADEVKQTIKGRLDRALDLINKGERSVLTFDGVRR